MFWTILRPFSKYLICDFEYVLIEKELSYDNDLPPKEKIILDLYDWLKKLSLSEEKAFGLDNSLVKIEYYPLLLNKNIADIPLKRRADKKE